MIRKRLYIYKKNNDGKNQLFVLIHEIDKKKFIDTFEIRRYTTTTWQETSLNGGDIKFLVDISNFRVSVFYYIKALNALSFYYYLTNIKTLNEFLKKKKSKCVL